jgi:hypothetical protein
MVWSARYTMHVCQPDLLEVAVMQGSQRPDARLDRGRRQPLEGGAHVFVQPLVGGASGAGDGNGRGHVSGACPPDAVAYDVRPIN